VYGPVHSRRFGTDTGINLLPLNKKVCTFDCVYCQYGPTLPIKTAAEEFPSETQIITELNRYKKRHPIDHITVAGNGEPTMHPRFERMARAILYWRNEYSKGTPIAIFTNGFRLTSPRIMSVVRQFDEPIVKLDAGDALTIHKLDRPAAGFDFDKFVQSLKSWPGLIIQSMFVAEWNDSMSDVNKWIQVLAEIRPASVQIYTIDRVPALKELKPVSHQWLMKMSEFASQSLQIPVKPY
jgi:wyosine [tRNA(Phe)-imidazoG37] synthetase (radical SAM superfamily)